MPKELQDELYEIGTVMKKEMAAAVAKGSTELDGLDGAFNKAFSGASSEARVHLNSIYNSFRESMGNSSDAVKTAMNESTSHIKWFKDQGEISVSGFKKAFKESMGSLSKEGKEALGGVSKEFLAEVEKMASKGKVSFNTLEAAFDKATDGMTDDAKEAFRKIYNDATDQLDKTGNGFKSLGETAKGQFSIMKAAIADLISEGFQWLIDKTKELASNVVRTGIDFTNTMSQVKAITGATDDEFQTLTDTAREWGAKSVFSATESAEALKYMGMAGWTVQQSIDGLPGVLNLAAAAGADLGEASDILTDTLTAFGEKASEATRLADIMAATATSSNTDVHMMGETFKYVAAVAGAFGYSMEDVSVAIGLMANSGVKGSEAGTALRSILSRLAAPPKEAAEAMSKYGISITDTNGKMKPFGEIMEDLRNKLGGLSEAEQAAAAKHIAGQEAMTGLLTIVNASNEDFAKLTNSINNSSGAAETMATVMTDNLGGDIEEMKGALEELGLKIYDKLEEPLRTAVQFITDKVIPKLEEFVQWVSDNSEEITKWATVIGVVVGTFTLLSTAVAAVDLAMKILSMNPIVLAITAIVAVVALLAVNFDTVKEFATNAWNKIEEVWGAVVEWFSNIVDGIKEAFAGIGEWFGTKFSEAKEAISNAWSGIKDWAGEKWEDIKTAFSDTKKWFSDTFTKAKDGISKAWSNVKTWAGDRWTDIKDAFKDTKDWFGDTFTKAKDAAQNAWSTTKTYFSNKWNDIQTAFSTTKDWFKEKFDGAWTNVKNAFKDPKGFFDDVNGKIQSALGAADTWMGDKFGDAWTNIKNKFAPVKNFFTGVWDDIKGIFSKVGTSIGDGIKGAVNGAVNTVLKNAAKIINMFIDGINFAIGIINGIPGVNIGKLKKLEVPEMAKGGIVDSATLAVVGEQGKEAVMPLENNLEWLDKLATMLNDRMGGNQPIVLNVDGKRFAEISVDSINSLTRQRGSIPLVIT